MGLAISSMILRNSIVIDVRQLILGTSESQLPRGPPLTREPN
jgi:hypothetical protein